MRAHARLHAPVLLALGAAAAARSQAIDDIAWPVFPSEPGDSPEAPQPPSPIGIHKDNAQAASASTLSPYFLATPAQPPIAPGSRPPGPIYTNATTTSPSPSLSPSPSPSTSTPAPTVITFFPPTLPSTSASPNLNVTSPSLNETSSTERLCSGCILAGNEPLTTWFDSKSASDPWTSVVVTETVVTEFITYMNNNTVDGVVTEERTLNQTKTVTGTDNQIITHTTPTFTVQVSDGVVLQFDAGPTYVIYNNIYGGPDAYISTYYSEYDWTKEGCTPTRTSLTGWQPAMTALNDWNYFVETYLEPLPDPTNQQTAVQLPTQAVEYLGREPGIQSQFSGLDLASCSLRPPPAREFSSIQVTLMPIAPAPTAVPPEEQPQIPAPEMPTPSTATYISTTYETTSVHNTVRGCLRCIPDPSVSVKESQPTPTSGSGSGEHNVKPDDPNRADTPDGSSEPNKPTGNGGNPVNTPAPIQNEPDSSDQDNQGQQNLPPPVVIIGDQTLKPGQTQTVGGVTVVRPSDSPADGETPRVIVGGTTVVFTPAPSPSPPVLTVGGGTVAANPQGEFVLGTETLKPGGAPVVVNGNTVSLGSGGIAVVNGVTQTIAGGASTPAVTGAPPLVVGGQTVYATQVGGSSVYVIAPAGQTSGSGYWVVNGGTTAYVPAPGQTVIPSSTLSISATSYWLPQGAPAGVVVINGVTSTMGPGAVVVVNGVTSTVASGAVITSAPALTINDLTYTQTVRDGTTEYVLGDGTTLAPGSTVVMDGTTYSLDESGTALVINGQTSAIPKLPKSNSASLTSSSAPSSATMTTGRNAGDLIASGVGQTSKGVGTSVQHAGIDKWIESLVIGAAGWLVMFL